MKINYINSEFLFEVKSDEGKTTGIYTVLAKGNRPEIIFEIFSYSGKCLARVKKEYGHANKTQALNILTSYLNDKKFESK